jgi:hypothetical protein
MALRRDEFGRMSNQRSHEQLQKIAVVFAALALPICIAF